jgi:hypothetical protein
MYVTHVLSRRNISITTFDASGTSSVRIICGLTNLSGVHKSIMVHSVRTLSQYVYYFLIVCAYVMNS